MKLAGLFLIGLFALMLFSGVNALDYNATYVEGDVAPIAFDFLGGVLAALVLLVPVIGLSMLVMWIRA